MIIVTGAAGFIGSNLLAHLQEEQQELVAVVNLDSGPKWRNLRNKRLKDIIDKEKFIQLIIRDQLPFTPLAIVHLGANSSTTEIDCQHLLENNFEYSKVLAQYAIKNKIRFIYASSAATYGTGTHGFSDSDEFTPQLQPINPYGFSKWLFDQWVLTNSLNDQLTGLRFFNVYGPNEQHKQGQSSPVEVFLKQLQSTGVIRLFKSENPDFKDGEQRRDFVYVRDCCKVISWLLANPTINGIFNIGTGAARTWIEMAEIIAKSANLNCSIDFIELPEELREQYQYYTQADLTKLHQAGYNSKMTNLEDGVREYVQEFLLKGAFR